MKLYLIFIAILASFVSHANAIYKVSYSNKSESFMAENDISAAEKIRNWIICEEIKSNNCVVKNDKVKRIAHEILTAKNITYENFCIPNQEFMKKIHRGLLKVISGESPTVIYNSDITESTMPREIWMQYVSQYNTKEKAEEYIKGMPVSMDIVIESFQPQAKFFAERWILYDKILKSFNLEYTSSSNEEAKKAEKAWWGKKLIDMSITVEPEIPQERIAAMKKSILNSITVRIDLGPKSTLVFLDCLQKEEEREMGEKVK